jgi:hypothetical protein
MLKLKTGEESYAVLSCSNENVLGDPPPQRDEEPERETEMHSGSWTKNTKSTVAENEHRE